MANDLTQTTQRSLDEQVISNLGRLQEQGLEMPPGYSPQNALKSAFSNLLTIQVEICYRWLQTIKK